LFSVVIKQFQISFTFANNWLVKSFLQDYYAIFHSFLQGNQKSRKPAFLNEMDYKSVPD